MFIITRYVIREVLQAFFVTLTATTLLMALVVATKDGLKLGLPPIVIVRTIPFVITEMLRFTLPGSMLFAVCTAFGRLSANNELTALKSLGITPRRVMIPVFGLAALLSINAVGLYEVSAVWCRPGLTAAIADSTSDIIYSTLQMHRTLNTPEIEMSVREVIDRKLIGVCASLKRAEDGKFVTLSAEEAELRRSPGSETLTLSCRNGCIEVGDHGMLRTSDHFEVAIDVGRMTRMDRTRISSMSRHQLPVETEQCAAQAEQARRRVEEATDPATEAAARNELQSFRRRLTELLVEPQRRWAAGFTCLGFVLIGVPAATLSKHGETLPLFFVCFLPIMLLYYPLFVVSESYAKSGVIPTPGVWLPNVVMAFAGSYLLHRALRR
jgi:lipopolysaccharide export system permease protein